MAVLEWRVQGTGAATGRPYDNEYCGVYVIHNGVIVEVREYLNTRVVRDSVSCARPSAASARSIVARDLWSDP